MDKIFHNSFLFFLFRVKQHCCKYECNCVFFQIQWASTESQIEECLMKGREKVRDSLYMPNIVWLRLIINLAFIYGVQFNYNYIGRSIIEIACMDLFTYLTVLINLCLTWSIDVTDDAVKAWHFSIAPFSLLGLNPPSWPLAQPPSSPTRP